MKILTTALLLVASAASAEVVNLTWDAVTNATGYKLYSSTNNGASFKFELGTSSTTVSINAETNVTTWGVASTNSTKETAATLVDMLQVVRNVRQNGNTFSWDANPPPTTGYVLFTSTNMVNWQKLVNVPGRTNTSFTSPLAANVVGIGVHAMSPNSASFRSPLELLKPVTNLRVVNVDQ